MTPTLLMACRTHRTPGCPICVPADAELREETAKRQCAERLAKASRRRSRLNCVIGFGVCLLFSAVLLLVDQTATLTEERDQLQTKKRQAAGVRFGVATAHISPGTGFDVSLRGLVDEE